MPNIYYYTSPKSKSQYMLNTTADTHANAEAACNLWGGHLAMWESLTEQSEVEQAFVSDGGLISSFQQSYWMGLEVQDWPQFAWMDKTVLAPSKRTYSHWIKNAPGNRAFGCGLANWNTSYTLAWGWQDADCDMQLVYICELSSGWRRWQLALCGLLLHASHMTSAWHLAVTPRAPHPCPRPELRPCCWCCCCTLVRRAQDCQVQEPLQPVHLPAQHHRG